MKILFVCSSNVCRSPYSEFHFRKLMEENGELSSKVEWCKSGAVFNRSQKLHSKAKACLMEEGFSEELLNTHKPAYIKDERERFDEADLIVGMTRSHKWFLPKELRKKYLNLSEAAGDNYKAIPDPFLAPNQKEYNKVMAVISEYVKRFAQKLIEE